MIAGSRGDVVSRMAKIGAGAQGVAAGWAGNGRSLVAPKTDSSSAKDKSGSRPRTKRYCILRVLYHDWTRKDSLNEIGWLVL